MKLKKTISNSYVVIYLLRLQTETGRLQIFTRKFVRQIKTDFHMTSNSNRSLSAC